MKVTRSSSRAHCTKSHPKAIVVLDDVDHHSISDVDLNVNKEAVKHVVVHHIVHHVVVHHVEAILKIIKQLFDFRCKDVLS